MIILSQKNIRKKFFNMCFCIWPINCVSIYKLNSAGVFNPNITKYQTGSDIALNYQIFKNILIGFAINIREFIIFDVYKINNINFYKILFFNLLIGVVFYLILIKKKKEKLKFSENNKNIFLFFILFVASMFPLYFHYISDRHNYLPSFFMFWNSILFKIFYNIKSNFFKTYINSNYILLYE